MQAVFIGPVLTAFRKSKGMSQIQMAQAIGVDRQYLKDVEADRKQMKKPLMDKLERAFSITQADFFAFYISNPGRNVIAKSED